MPYKNYAFALSFNDRPLGGRRASSKGAVSDVKGLIMSVNGGEEGAEKKALQDLEKAETDLANAETEIKAAEKELEEARKHRDTVVIVVDGEEHRVRAGKWLVSELKAKVGVDPAKVLAEITPKGLRDLADNEEIHVREAEQFMSHARSGGSS